MRKEGGGNRIGQKPDQCDMMWSSPSKPWLIHRKYGMDNAHHICLILDWTCQNFIFLSCLVTRCGLHQEGHAPGRAALNLRLTPKELIAQGWPLTILPALKGNLGSTSACLNNLQQYDYWKQFSIMLIVLFVPRVYTLGICNQITIF